MKTYYRAQGTVLSALWCPKWERNKTGHIRILTANSLCCTEEANTTL